LQGTNILEIRFLEFSLESFIPALMHGIFLEVIDGIDNLISSGGAGSSSTVSTTVVTSSLLGHRMSQRLSPNECHWEGYLSETFLRFSAGTLVDAVATSAAPLLRLTPNTASNVVCTAARGGMMVVVGRLVSLVRRVGDSLRDYDSN
jgi:hypothetical protein